MSEKATGAPQGQPTGPQTNVAGDVTGPILSGHFTGPVIIQTPPPPPSPLRRWVHRYGILLVGALLAGAAVVGPCLGAWPAWLPYGLIGLAVVFGVAGLWSRPRRLAWTALIVVAALGLGCGQHWLATPRFTVTALNTLEGDANAYELTDMLLWNRDTPEQGLSFSFPLAIQPGRCCARYPGPVVAIISGASSLSKTVTLWDEFSPQTPPARLELSLAEIATLSGLQANSPPAVHSLNPEAPFFETAQLVVQIAPVDNPAHPWDTATVTIRNAPWYETAVLVARNGRYEVDYYLKNWGGPGDFTVHYRLARHTSTEPYGQNLVTGNTPLPLAHLAHGQALTLTLPLTTTGLAPGQYFVEVYAIKKQNYVQNPQVNWETPDLFQNWWFCARPTQVLALEITAPVSETVKAEVERLRQAAQVELGAPLAAAQPVTSARGTPAQYQPFEQGAVYLRDDGPVTALYGALWTHYQQLGGPASPYLGLPLAPAQPVTSTTGVTATVVPFEGPPDWPAALYASAQGVAGIWGALAQTYQEVYGGPGGWLGLPLSEAQVYPNSVIQNFERGYLVFYFTCVEGQCDYNRPPLAYPYLASRGTLLDVQPAPWQATGVTVNAGDRLTLVQVGGAWSHWLEGTPYDANGSAYPGLQADALLPTAPTGALIGQLTGPAGSQTFPVGRWSVVTATLTGTLSLAMNDNQYSDNGGFITVQIWVEPR